MIKLVYTIRRRADFSPADFQRRWLEHGALVRSVAEAIHATRYVQSHTLDTPRNARLAASRGMADGYDGITEVWWNNLDDLLAGLATDEGREAQRRLLADEAEFIDFANSAIFLTAEHEIFDFR